MSTKTMLKKLSKLERTHPSNWRQHALAFVEEWEKGMVAGERDRVDGPFLKEIMRKWLEAGYLDHKFKPK